MVNKSARAASRDAAKPAPPDTLFSGTTVSKQKPAGQVTPAGRRAVGNTALPLAQPAAPVRAILARNMGIARRFKHFGGGTPVPICA